MAKAKTKDNTLTRRAAMGKGALALVCVAAVPAAVAVGASVPVLTHDRQLTLIREYEAELGIIDSIDDPSQRRVNAWQRKAHAILGEAASLPCLTAASAVAVLDLIVKDEMLESTTIFSDHFPALVGAVKDYLAGRVA
jgi:hypothetical protein